ncbi:MAG: uracil-DNA glycosylase [Tepidisphaeraceae bacterium]
MTDQSLAELRRARVDLALRAERAFGLDALRRPAAPVAVASELFAAPGISGVSVLPTEEKVQHLRELDESEVRACTKCRLCDGRTQTVFGEGNPDAGVMFIGEAPGRTEDETGRPFVGRAGELLTRMIAGMGLRRDQVYIANIVKCRPPENREPAPDEVATCTPYLQRQIEIIRPKVIVTLGRPATEHMLARKVAITRLRGQWHEWRGIKLMPTYHPAYLLRNYTQATRGEVWSDLQLVMKELGLPMPARSASGK